MSDIFKSPDETKKPLVRILSENPPYHKIKLTNTFDSVYFQKTSLRISTLKKKNDFPSLTSFILISQKSQVVRSLLINLLVIVKFIFKEIYRSVYSTASTVYD